MHFDPTSQLINQIKMGLKSKQNKIVLDTSKFKISILNILKSEGYIDDFKIIVRNKISSTVIYLKYKSGVSIIHGIKQISKPGLRIYVEANKLPRVLGGLGIAIVSTSKGLMCAKHARRLNVGGEVITYVW